MHFARARSGLGTTYRATSSSTVETKYTAPCSTSTLQNCTSICYFDSGLLSGRIGAIASCLHEVPALSCLVPRIVVPLQPYVEDIKVGALELRTALQVVMVQCTCITW
jgi:hypothetical protein